MLKLSVHLFDELESGRRPIVGREIEIERTIELFNLPELAAYTASQMLKLDFLADIEEEITNTILEKVGNFRSINESIPTIDPAELAEMMLERIAQREENAE